MGGGGGMGGYPSGMGNVQALALSNRPFPPSFMYKYVPDLYSDDDDDDDDNDEYSDDYDDNDN